MRVINVKYSQNGKILTIDDTSVYFEQENNSLRIDAEITNEENTKVRAYIKAPNGNSHMTEAIEPNGVYSVVINKDFMAKGTLYVGFEVFDESGYIERFEPLKVYIDSFVNLGTGNTDNVYVVTVDVAETVTLPADEGAKAEVVNIGTQKDMRLKFYIPKGDTGEPGYTPQKGTDYYTPEEAEAFASEVEQKYKQSLDNKVDKVEGKGLSSNDFTYEKLMQLSDLNYWASDNTASGNKLTKDKRFKINPDNDEEVESVELLSYSDTWNPLSQKHRYFKDTKAREQIELLERNKIDKEYFANLEEVVAGHTDEIELLANNKVSKEVGKGLSTNDFVNGYKNLLDQRMIKGSDVSASSRGLVSSKAVYEFVDDIATDLDERKVEKKDGYGLSKNDFTDKHKSLLDKPVGSGSDVGPSVALVTSRAVYEFVDEQTKEKIANIPMQKIYETTTTAVVVEITDDKLKNLKLDEIYVNISLPAETTLPKTSEWYGYVNGGTAEDGSSKCLYYLSADTTGRFFSMKAERMCKNIWFSQKFSKMASNTANATLQSSYVMSGVDYIDSLRIVCPNLPAGTAVTVCGRKVVD